MNAHELQLKQIIHQAGLDAGLAANVTRANVESVMSALSDDDDVFDVAAKALCEMCIDGGRFNGSTVGIKAVLRFLAEAIPEDNHPVDNESCLRALADTMKRDCTSAELRKWAVEWYS